MRPLIALLCAAALGLAACGESKEDKASDAVCDARAGINKEVDALSQMTPSTITIDAVRQSLQAIGDDVRQIVDAQRDLSKERRAEVQSANQAFAAEIRDVAGTVGRSLSGTDARQQLASAADALANTYKQTYARVDC
jgi:hypothetical protein